MLSIHSLQLSSFNINPIYDSSNRLQSLANLLKDAAFKAKAGLEQNVMTAFSQISTKAVDYITTFQSYSTLEKISVVAYRVLLPLAVIFTVIWCVKKAANINLFQSGKQNQEITTKSPSSLKPESSIPVIAQLKRDTPPPGSPKSTKTPPSTPAAPNPLARQLSPETPLHKERSASSDSIESLAPLISKTEASITQSAPASRASSPLKADPTSIGGAGIPLQDNSSSKPPTGPKGLVRSFLKRKDGKTGFSTLGNRTPPRSRASSTGSNPLKEC